MRACIGVVLLFAGCAEVDSDSACDREPTLTYENFGQGFMDQYCNGCHSSLVPAPYRNDAPESVNFDTYAAVIAQRERISVRTDSLEPTMPPGGGPTTEELEVLHEWLSCAVAEDAAALGEE